MWSQKMSQPRLWFAWKAKASFVCFEVMLVEKKQKCSARFFSGLLQFQLVLVEDLGAKVHHGIETQQWCLAFGTNDARFHVLVRRSDEQTLVHDSGVRGGSVKGRKVANFAGVFVSFEALVRQAVTKILPVILGRLESLGARWKNQFFCEELFGAHQISRRFPCCGECRLLFLCILNSHCRLPRNCHFVQHDTVKFIRHGNVLLIRWQAADFATQIFFHGAAISFALNDPNCLQGPPFMVGQQRNPT